MPPLRRVLVANRGEIARRVIRAAHDAGLEAVAVYAPDDANAPHVGEADLAVALTGAGLAGTYLSVDAVIEAAGRADADAVHPGYGFLSEDPALAEACAAAGLAWVGPPPAAMAVMGHKARAKETVAAAGVPVLPGAVVGDEAGATLAALGQGVGYPLLVKASAGGGGRGMRLVESAAGLAESVVAARREAGSSFGSDEVFLERFLAAPRHIEVQVVADAHGTTLHLFDRECSVQRRHQKVIEEAPAVAVPQATRQRMWQAAVDAATAVGYVGVGTVEFLVEGTECFFLEMNTRLQVEHGVTELVTGLDLVQLQLDVAGGGRLALDQPAVVARGHAVEARLCAERPREGYRPTPGVVRHVRWPDGEGIRVDAAVEQGSAVSPAYDSLVAKVLAHGADRPTAVGRLRRALVDLELDGLETNRDLLCAVLGDDEFGAHLATTDYLGRRGDLVEASLPGPVRRRHAAAAGLHLQAVRSAASLVPSAPPGWRNVGGDLHADALRDGDGVLAVAVERRRDAVRVLVTEEGDTADAAGATGFDTVRLGPRSALTLVERGAAVPHRVRWHEGMVAVNGPEGQSTFTMHREGEAEAAGATAGECRAPLPGAVTQVLVAVGDEVDDGTGLVVLEAMKMEHTLRAAGPGVVREVHAGPGQQVDVGDLLVVVEPA